MKVFASILAACMFLSTLAFAQEDRRIFVHNNASKRIVALYGKPIDQANYYYNMIRGPQDWIRVGDSKLADIDDGTGYCRYDLKAVLADGRVAERFNVNVCVMTDWWIHD